MRPSCASSSSSRLTRLQRLISRHSKNVSRGAQLLKVPNPSKILKNPPREKRLPQDPRLQIMEGRGYGRDGASYLVKKSNRPTKKYRAINLANGNAVHFGHPDYEDYTMHRDPSRKASYLKRHTAREDWRDLNTPGAWSRHLLWSEPSIDEAARRMQKRFNIDITLEL